jgi:5'-nucleotidase
LPHVAALRPVPLSLLLAALLVSSPVAGQDPPPATTGAPTPFTILITNDDGFDAPGLQALVKAFAGAGEIYVSAPVANQSGAGHSVTLADAVVVADRTLEGVVRAVAVDGSPATAARVGLERTVPRTPNLVISGINRGENLGMSVYLSGTLGAAREAAFAGVAAIAVSIMGNRPETYEAAAAAARELVDDLRARQLIKPGLFLNVNVPAGATKGTKVTRLSLRASKVEHECSPTMRQRVACFPAFRQTLKDEAGTDIGEFYQGYVTVTPMTLDATDAAAMASMRFVEGVK